MTDMSQKVLQLVACFDIFCVWGKCPRKGCSHVYIILDGRKNNSQTFHVCP